MMHPDEQRVHFTNLVAKIHAAAMIAAKGITHDASFTGHLDITQCHCPQEAVELVKRATETYDRTWK